MLIIARAEVIIFYVTFKFKRTNMTQTYRSWTNQIYVLKMLDFQEKSPG